jgi:hypothetical protein
VNIVDFRKLSFRLWFRLKIEVLTSNTFVNNIPVGIEPRGLDINPNTNMVYVANWLSGTISVIDGTKNKLTTVSRFNVSPPNAGLIECNGNKISSNYSRYNIDTPLECEAKANDGFTFSSWSGDYLPSSNLNTPTTTFKVSKYGTLSANFIQSSTVSVPPEFWTPLYGLIPGFFIPSIISWLNGRRQRGYLQQYITQIGKFDKNRLEKRITSSYIEGKINDSHYQLLKDKISEYYDSVDTSQGSPIK